MANFSAHWDYINHRPQVPNRVSLGNTIVGRRSLDKTIGLNGRRSTLLTKLAACAQMFTKKNAKNVPRPDMMGEADFSP